METGEKEKVKGGWQVQGYFATVHSTPHLIIDICKHYVLLDVIKRLGYNDGCRTPWEGGIYKT